MEQISVKNPGKAARSSKLARPQLDRQDWIDGGLDILAEQGLSGLRVELLAKAHGVTKGSFYWHFRDRQDLLSAVLDYWKEGRILDIEKITAPQPGKEIEQLHNAIEIYSASRNRKGMAIELAIRDWARRDPLAASVVEAVDLFRLECTYRLFAATGVSDEEARSRSLMLYACVFGLSLMCYDPFSDDLAGLKTLMAKRIVGRDNPF